MLRIQRLAFESLKERLAPPNSGFFIGARAGQELVLDRFDLGKFALEGSLKVPTMLVGDDVPINVRICYKSPYVKS